jgi:hypothetical protein
MNDFSKGGFKINSSSLKRIVQYDSCGFRQSEGLTVSYSQFLNHVAQYILTNLSKHPAASILKEKYSILMEALNTCKTFLPTYRTTGCCNCSNQVLTVLNLPTELR